MFWLDGILGEEVLLRDSGISVIKTDVCGIDPWRMFGLWGLSRECFSFFSFFKFERQRDRDGQKEELCA